MKAVIRIWIPERVWITTQQQSDSNPFSTDSNPNSSKGYFDGLIRITIQVIWIPGEEEVKLRATNSNPSWRTSEEIEGRIRITYTTIWIPHEEQVKRLKHRFEWPTQWFETLSPNIGSIMQGDSNLWVTDLNPFTNEAKGWKSDRTIRIIKLLIRITQWRKS